jgi:hypothetical protein
MKELYELIKYLKDNGYEHLKINPDLLVGIVEYFESKQEPKKCSNCNGDGWIMVKGLVPYDCDRCNGNGKL